jgi:hypothetical protein
VVCRCSRADSTCTIRGFHYYEDDDLGVFWSDDPGIPVGEMVRSMGVLEIEEEMAQVRKFCRKAGMLRS